MTEAVFLSVVNNAQPEVAVLLAPGVEANMPLPLLVLATPLLVKLA